MRAAKVDLNHNFICQVFRKAGAKVCSLGGVGKGVPDLMVGLCGHNVLVEVKDPVKGQLNRIQVKWHGDWPGQVAVVRTEEDVAKLVIAVRQLSKKSGPDWAK